MPRSPGMPPAERPQKLCPFLVTLARRCTRRLGIIRASGVSARTCPAEATRYRARMQTVGILGGMGPEASVRFLELLVRNTAAAVDQDHVPTLLWSCPQIPDRTAALLRGGESPVPWLARGAATLTAAGADFLVMPCVTAHGFWPQVAPQIRLPLVHLLHAALDDLRSAQADIKTIGLLATHGTVQTRVVHDVFEPAGIQILLPSDSDQARVMEAIYGREGIKAGVTTGHPRAVVCEIALQLIQAGAEAILAGCTEIPLVLKPTDLTVPLIEPLVSGARACIRRAGGKLKTDVVG